MQLCMSSKCVLPYAAFSDWQDYRKPGFKSFPRFVSARARATAALCGVGPKRRGMAIEDPRFPG